MMNYNNLIEDERFPKWLFDIENGKIWSKKENRFIGASNKKNGYTVQNICQCCNGKRKSADGYLWSYIKYENNKDKTH